MKTLQTIVYDFSELSKEAKEKAIEQWYEHEEYPFFKDDIDMYVSEKDDYFYDRKLQYSLSCCQGDGLSFSAKFSLYKWLNERTNLKESVKRTLCELATICSKGNTGHYCFASRGDIELDFDNNYERPNIESLAEKLRDEIADYYISLCMDAEKYGYDILEYRMDELEFDDLCNDMGYTFLQDGTMKNY
ncbi:MAG: hypothetical protein WC389_21685 [Lutibacter sp.]|jgi:hypothetical protein